MSGLKDFSNVEWGQRVRKVGGREEKGNEFPQCPASRVAVSGKRAGANRQKRHVAEEKRKARVGRGGGDMKQ